MLCLSKRRRWDDATGGSLIYVLRWEGSGGVDAWQRRFNGSIQASARAVKAHRRFSGMLPSGRAGLALKLSLDLRDQAFLPPPAYLLFGEAVVYGALTMR